LSVNTANPAESGRAHPSRPASAPSSRRGAA
jgi:hypothetical protein